VLHVRAADWGRALEHPDQPLRYELFGAYDGYPGRANIDTRLPTAVSPDGHHVWFLATGGVVGLDSANLRRNAVPPDPMVLDVQTDGGRLGARPGLRLPPGANNFRIQFTAPALRQPERVRFQYRLDGVDANWQDAGTRRMTSYTNVGPGDYVFRLRALNEDGIASTGDVTLPLAVEPTLAQGVPFRVGGALALLALATVLYRLRVRYLTRRLTERLTERAQVKLSERERIARTLHDTILQAVQALMLRLDTLASALPAGDRTRAALEKMLKEAGSAIGAGRDQVRELRATEVPAPEDVLHACAAELQAMYPEVAFELRMDGMAQELSPAVAEEVGHIGCEALRNAYTHAHARRIVVRLGYGRRGLALAVEDDGRGLDDEIRRDGYRSGHWGLIGMRERAERIGARLEVAGDTGRGTTIALDVPAARAYAGRAA
jgi:signal transduction histidine kinase